MYVRVILTLRIGSLLPRTHGLSVRREVGYTQDL